MSTRTKSPTTTPVRAITSHLVHACFPSTLYVLTLDDSATVTFTFATRACAKHHPFSVWIGTSHNTLLRLTLPECDQSIKVINLHPLLLSSPVPHAEHPQLSAVVTHDLGSIFSLLSSHALPETCQCRKTLFCDRGVASFEEPSHGTTTHLPLSDGCSAHDPHAARLVVRAPRRAPAPFMIITRCGGMYFVHSLFPLQLPEPFANMYQTPVAVFFPPDCSFVTVVGQLRSVFTLAFVEDDSISETIALPQSNASFSLDSFAFHSASHAKNQLLLQPTSDVDLPPVHIHLHLTPPRITHTMYAFSFHSQSTTKQPAIRPLLQAIDRLTLRSAEQSATDTAVQQNISTALHTFASLKSAPMPLSVTLTVSDSPQGHVPAFHLPHPPRSKQVYVIAHLQSQHSGSLSSLSLQLTLAPHRIKSTSSMPKPNRNHPHGQSFSAPLPTLTSADCVKVSFPLYLSSHAPVKAAVSLSIDIPSTEPLELAIGDELLDILSYSNRVSQLGEDTSAAIFAMPFSDPHKATIQHSRLCVPYSLTQVQQILSLKPEPTHFRSLLGAPFSLLLSGGRACTITLRAPTHVTPFVRAALLRRLMQTKPEPIIVKGIPNIRTWSKELKGCVEKCESSSAETEEKLVEAVKVFEDLENGAGADGTRIWKESLAKAAQAYRAWRREGENIWMPTGSEN
ncbi:hypothetical protein BWQ96_05061 [Gracilariopsis chorda]|uniref:Uncharacterized protein n=1 Tax=Gracilariopsis chorda TaxID=448386 RepID=A0A2V3IVJ4_9FLOR|nr:hypothetical protein BWQ96_05061 [Gracilariopsis chorda]|eukprot:PXF45160.1 hypothetical protein BWQ96_05061 [Gracilariopsis chorda]